LKEGILDFNSFPRLNSLCTKNKRFHPFFGKPNIKQPYNLLIF
jgi:hypothetical protein